MACTPGKNARADKIAPKMICRFCIGEFFSFDGIWFAVNVIWCAVGPRSRAPPFVCSWLTDSLRKWLRKIAGDCQDKYETLKPQKETIAAVMPLRVLILLVAKIFPHFSDWPSLR